MEKIDSNKNTLSFKISVITLSLMPLFANAVTIINDNNIARYSSSGIKINSDDAEIRTTSSTSPHINQGASGTAIEVARSKTLTIGAQNDNNTFTIQTNVSSGSLNSSTGVRIVGASSKVISNQKLDLIMDNGTGVYIAAGGAKGIFNKDVSIDGKGTGTSGFVGIRAYNSQSSVKSTGTFNGKVTIKSKGKGSYGIGATRSASPNETGVQLDFNDHVTIKMNGEDAQGIHFDQHYQLPIDTVVGSKVNFNEGVNLEVTNGLPIYMRQSGGILTINSDSNQNSIISVNAAEENAIETYSGTININGNSKIKGDVYSVTDVGVGGLSKINFDLTDGSRLLTSMDNYHSSTNPPYLKGTINLKISGNNSQWKMTNNSSIDSLTLGDDAKISFGYSYANPDSISFLDNINTRKVLTTGSLAGNGIFEMRTAIGTHQDSDLLKVTESGQAVGSHKITINDKKTGAATVTGKERIRLVETEGGGADFKLTSPYVDIGAYQFDTLTEVGDRDTGTKDWVLSGTLASNNNNNNNNNNTDNNGGANENGDQNSPISSKPKLTSTAQNAANILNSNYLMNYVETQTLLQRMGQLRANDTTHNGAWGRIYTGKLNSFNDKRLSGFDMDYYGLQFGIDRKLDHNNQNIYYGMMGGLSKGDVDHKVGDGNTKSYSVALYTTLQNQAGWYIDGLLKYMHMSNKFNSLTGGGYRVKGHGNTDGFSIGTEVGKRIQLSPETQNAQGWYLEPQAQVTFSHQNSATINATNGLKTKLGSYNSLIARASIILGYTINENDNPIDIYFKTGYLREFDGKTSYTFNRVAKEKYDFGGNWWDNGIGVNMKLNQKHNFYGDVAYSLGNKFDRKQVNIGYRFDF